MIKKISIFVLSVFIMLIISIPVSAETKTYFENEFLTGSVTVTGQEQIFSNKEITIRAVKYNSEITLSNTAYVKQVTADANGNFTHAFELSEPGSYNVYIMTNAMTEPRLITEKDSSNTIVVYATASECLSAVTYVAGKLSSSNMFFRDNINANSISVSSFTLTSDLEGKGTNIIWTSDSTIVTITDGKNAIVSLARNAGKIINLTATIKKGFDTKQVTIPITIASQSTSTLPNTSGSPSKGSSGGVTTPISLTPFPTPTTPPTSHFDDLDSVPWAQECINALADKEIVKGVSERIFEPNRNITRAEFITFLINAFELNDNEAKSTFTDVSYGEWYYISIASAQKHGLTDGYSDGTFGVNNEISREEMATLAYRVAVYAKLSLPELVETITFLDNDDIAGYASDAIKVLTQAKIINGIGDNMFAPKNPATRAQAAVIIYGIIKFKI